MELIFLLLADPFEQIYFSCFKYKRNFLARELFRSDSVENGYYSLTALILGTFN